MSLQEYLSELGIGPRRFITDRQPIEPPKERPEMSQSFVSWIDGKLWRYDGIWKLTQGNK